MKVFILPNVAECTSKYHSGGGIVVVANDITAAKEALQVYRCCKNPDVEDGWCEVCGRSSSLPVITEEEWEAAEVIPCGVGAKPRVHVFPDAGCC